MSNQELLDEQTSLAELICTELRLCICTCGSCGCTIITNIGEEDIECYDCGFTGEPCDFPDLFY